MNKQLPSLRLLPFFLTTLLLPFFSRAQGWQQSYPQTAGSSISSMDGEIKANLKNGLANSFFQANIANGSFTSLTTQVPDCDLAPFGGGDLRYSATEFFDKSLTASNDLKIRRVKLVPNTCTVDQVVFEQTYDLPAAVAAGAGNMVYDPVNQTLFIAGSLQLTPVSGSTQYSWFVKKINAVTGAQVWEYNSGTLTTPGNPPGFSLQLAPAAGGVILSYGGSGNSNGVSLSLRKLNGSGQVVYDKGLGGVLSFITSMSENSDGSLLIRMYSASFSGPGDNYRAIHWDANGNTLFSLHAGLTLGAYFGGSAFAYLTSFDAHVRLSNGDFLLAGKNTGGTGGAIPGAHISRVSPTGTVLWTRFYPGLLVDFTHALETFPDNGFLLGGRLNNEVFLMKTNSLGLVNAGPGEVDLQLTSTASQLNPAQWSNTTITYTLQNTGTAAANGITVRVGVCDDFIFGQNSGLVYANTNFQASVGTYLHVSQAWNITTLGPGEVATLSFTLFSLTNGARRVFGEIVSSTADVDSEPGTWPDCTPDEDDETVVTLNADNGCEIILDFLDTDCFDNGTPNDPNDDYYYANIHVGKTGSACSSDFVYQANGGISGTGFFFSEVAVGPLPTNLSSEEIGFTTGTGQTATVTSIYVLSPGHCSGNGTDCFITALDVNPQCNNNGTPNNPLDDTFTYDLWVQKTGDCGSQWTDGVNVFPYGSPVPYGSALIANGSFTVTVWDVDNPTSTAAASVNPAAPCSNGGGNCAIDATINNIQCSNNGTPTNPNDDTYTVDLLVTGTNTGSQGWKTTAGGVNVFGNYGQPKTFGPYNIVSGGGVFDVQDVANPTCTDQVTFAAPPPCSNGGTGQIDLSLTLQQLTASPAQWSNYQVKATVSNAGPQAATGVKVKFAKPTGVVYVGGNTHTASQGTFNALSDEIWTVGSVPANGSATLTVNYFLLNASAPTAYAQVTAHTQTDSDSQPNNGTPPTPVQDDEAATSGGGGPTPQPDLTIADLQIPNSSVAAGAVLNYNFDTGNSGTAAVPGNFTIKSYLSTDDVLSANDVQDGNINTGNYGVGFAAQNVAGASTISANLAPNQYFLIVKIDGNNVVAEGNENNNVVVKAFTVTNGGCSINPPVVTTTCNDNGTPNNPADDQFQLSMAVTGTNTGPAWAINGSNAGFAYGPNFLIANYPISGGAFTLTINDLMNTACNRQVTITPPAPCSNSGTPNCNAITITPGQNKITIAGASAPHVLIKVFKPNWQVAFECLDGACASPQVVTGLTAGSHFVEIKLLNASWGVICTKTQTVGVTNLGGGGGSALLIDDDGRQRMAFDKIYPNPAKYAVTLELFSKNDQPATLDFYDQQGRLVYREETLLAAGQNEVTVGVSDWKSGAYNVIARGEGMPAYGRFLKVWEE